VAFVSLADTQLREKCEPQISEVKSRSFHERPQKNCGWFLSCPSSFQEGMIEKRQMTLMRRTTDAIVAMLLSLRVQVNGNHNRVHASLKSSRGPRGMSFAGSP
jgi:hypothetical protein